MKILKKDLQKNDLMDIIQNEVMNGLLKVSPAILQVKKFLINEKFEKLFLIYQQNYQVSQVRNLIK